MNLRSRTFGFGSAAALVLAGIACAVIFSGGLGQNLAFVLVALGLVLATSLVFYEVGLTEDRQRASDERKRASEARGGESEARKGGSEAREGGSEAREGDRVSKPGHPPERSSRMRLDRARGRPRRLR